MFWRLGLPRKCSDWLICLPLEIFTVIPEICCLKHHKIPKDLKRFIVFQELPSKTLSQSELSDNFGELSHILHQCTSTYSKIYLTCPFWRCQPPGENLDIFNPLEFEIQRNSDHETPKIKFSLRALKRKNLIHGRVTPTVSKFSV